MPQLAALAARWPESIPVRESSIDPCAIARLYTAGAVELRTAAPKFTTAVSVMPRVSAVARAQARHGTVVANLRHEAVDLENPEAARLVASLDGTQPGGIHPPEVLERLARLALLES
jgi:hypothetical protein